MNDHFPPCPYLGGDGQLYTASGVGRITDVTEPASPTSAYLPQRRAQRTCCIAPFRQNLGSCLRRRARRSPAWRWSTSSPGSPGRPPAGRASRPRPGLTLAPASALGRHARRSRSAIQSMAWRRSRKCARAGILSRAPGRVGVANLPGKDAFTSIYTASDFLAGIRKNDWEPRRNPAKRDLQLRHRPVVRGTTGPLLDEPVARARTS